MNNILLMIILTGALPVSSAAQLDFDNPSKGAFDAMLADSAGAVPGAAPVMAEDPSAASCESFSAEAVMNRIPIYDQMLDGGKNGDSGICYAVTAAHMFDHWNLSQGSFGRQELVSPLMLDAAKRLRGDLSGGGELDEKTLLAMATDDACTLGVTPDSRRYLSVNEEAALARGTGAGGAGTPRETFDSFGDAAAYNRPPCTLAPVSGFRPAYQRTRSVEVNGRRTGQPFTLQELRGFFARNNANQPVAVKVSYGVIFGDGVAAPGGDPHWALVIARQHQAGRCQYLLRNSMGSDTPLIWVDEVRLQNSVRSMAVLTR